MRAAHQPRGFWAEHIQQIESRDISIAAYAREHDLSAASLYVWRGKLREEPSSVVSEVRFAEIITSTPVANTSLLLRIGEATLEFDALPDADWLARVLSNATTPI